MSTFDAVFAAARSLSDSDRLKLIDALWAMAPQPSEPPLDPAWEAELARRLAVLDASDSPGVDWEKVCERMDRHHAAG